MSRLDNKKSSRFDERDAEAARQAEAQQREALHVGELHESLKEFAREVLSRAHEVNAIGRIFESPEDEPPRGVGSDDFVEFLAVEVSALEEVVLRLAGELDELKGTSATG